MSVDLTSAERRRLRARAHTLAPIVQVGRQGVSEALLGELDRALTSHELIKMRLRGAREERAAQLDDITAGLGCAVVGTVGSVAILYRPAADEVAPAEADS